MAKPIGAAQNQPIKLSFETRDKSQIDLLLVEGSFAEVKKTDDTLGGHKHISVYMMNPYFTVKEEKFVPPEGEGSTRLSFEWSKDHGTSDLEEEAIDLVNEGAAYLKGKRDAAQDYSVEELKLDRLHRQFAEAAIDMKYYIARAGEE